MFRPCPLLPRKRTFDGSIPMSAKCQRHRRPSAHTCNRLALFESRQREMLKYLEERHETSTPSISASGSGRCRAPIVLQTARAQAYPDRPITLIVPFPPGGSTDVGARIVADHMSRTLGQQIVVQNVSGAGGTTG